IELVDHGVDGVLQLQDLAFHVDCDFAVEFAACHGGSDLGDIADLRGEVTAHGVDGVGQVFPRSCHPRNGRLPTKPALGRYLACLAGRRSSDVVELVNHRVDGVLQLQDLAFHIDRDFARKIAASDGRRDLSDVADLCSEVCRHRVHGIGEVLPGAGYARHDGLTAKAALSADLAGHAGHLRSKRPKLVHHRVDGFLELQNLAPHVDSDFLGQVTVGDSDCHTRDVANLRRQIAGHLIDGLGELFPYARYSFDLGLATKLALGTDLAGDAGDFRGENRQLLDHCVHELC